MLKSNMNPHVLIVGSSFKNLRDYLRAHDIPFTVLKDIKGDSGKTAPNKVICDFSNMESIFAAVDAVPQKIDAVICVYEAFVVAAAQIGEHLGLPHLPVKSAQACTDKSIMRELFAKAPAKISPAFQKVNSLHDALEFGKTHDFPLILKPVNLAKSLLITKVHDLNELEVVYKKTIAAAPAVYEKYAPNNKPEFLIEEFMEGPVHSVDAFIDSNGVPYVLEQVVDYQTGFDIGFDDNFHYSRIIPSKLSQTQIAEIREVAALGCMSLGMKNSPAHVEVILTKSGPRIVEIGARNGGYRERMHRTANGIDITANLLRVVQAQEPKVEATKNDPCAVLELFPKTPGIFTGISHEKELLELPSLTYFSIKQPIDMHVGKSSDGYKMCAIIMLHNQDSQQFEKDLAFVNEHVAVQTA